MKRVLWFTAGYLFIHAAVSASTQAGVMLNQNLITNGSAESGLTGWTSVHGGGGTVWRGPGAGYGFVGDIPQNVLLRQSGIDISSLATMIDSGELEFTMSGSMYSHASGDYASLWAYFDNGTHVLLNAGQYKAWQSGLATGIIPVGVRSLSFEIHLTFSGHPDGYNHAMADSFEFSLQAPANRTPTADAGGAYSLRDQEVLVLDASLSADRDSVFGDEIVSYSWDLNNDGVFDFTSSQAVTSLTASQYKTFFDQTGNYSLGLSVTDSRGASATAFSSLQFTSVPEPSTGISWLCMTLIGLTSNRRRQSRGERAKTLDTRY